MAGIDVIQLINEPTAAGLAYGVNEKQGDRSVLVLDLGGGTFDVSLISYAGGEVTILASNGDSHLGGKDVDDLMLDRVKKEFANEHGIEFSPNSHAADWFSAWEEIVRQKHMLSSRTEIKIMARADGSQVVLPMTREDLKKAIHPLLDRAKLLITETIQNGKVQPSEIQHVLLIGGSTRLVAFQEMVKVMFGQDSILGGQVSPDLAVAEGAVIHAVKMMSQGGVNIVDESLKAIPMPAISHTDVMPHSLGVAVQDRVSTATSCSAILERNTPIPCQTTKTYGSVDPDQTVFKVSVLQGEDGQATDDCLVVGDRELHLPPRSTSDPTLEVSMGYDASGMVKVQVKDKISGKIEDITVDFFSRT